MGRSVVVQLAAEPPLGPLFATVRDGQVLQLVADVCPGDGHDPVVLLDATRLTDDDRQVVERLQAGIGHWLATGTSDFDLGDLLDVERAGAFRSAVYRALASVPAGEQVTYGELASRAGHRGAARAVGQAMAANPWLLVVPCHRVVPASGGVGNYAAGPQRKAWMLAHESAAARSGGAAHAPSLRPGRSGG